MLAAHPEQSLVKIFIEGIMVGFELASIINPSQQKGSANSHPAIVTDYLEVKLNQNRVTGPFNTAILTVGHTSRFRVLG